MIIFFLEEDPPKYYFPNKTEEFFEEYHRKSVSFNNVVNSLVALINHIVTKIIEVLIFCDKILN